MVFVTVDGADELIEFLKQISSEKKADQVAYKIAKRTRDIAYRNAPEDTGKMENDIVVKKVGECEYEIECSIRYAVYNEFGTYCMPVGSGESPLPVTSTSGKHAYRPFLRPASIEVLSELDKIIDQTFFGQIKSLGDE
jgi:HK97 gp10 family phage protein